MHARRAKWVGGWWAQVASEPAHGPTQVGGMVLDTRHLATCYALRVHYYWLCIRKERKRPAIPPMANRGVAAAGEMTERSVLHAREPGDHCKMAANLQTAWHTWQLGMFHMFTHTC